MFKGKKRGFRSSLTRIIRGLFIVYSSSVLSIYVAFKQGAHHLKLQEQKLQEHYLEDKQRTTEEDLFGIKPIFF